VETWRSEAPVARSFVTAVYRVERRLTAGRQVAAYLLASWTVRAGKGCTTSCETVIARQSGPVILVGHSYGGVVITEAGNHPSVAGLVYIAAFAPDNGESVGSLIKNPPPGAPVPPILPTRDGFLYLDETKFAASFAADVDAKRAAFMAGSQVPWGLESPSSADACSRTRIGLALRHACPAEVALRPLSNGPGHLSSSGGSPGRSRCRRELGSSAAGVKR
jgi:pimeloyl-ACP methyl ester carboxylesterase